MINTTAIADNLNTYIRTGQKVHTESATINNMKVEDAARELGKSIQFVRVQLQRGLVTWGYAIIISGGRYTYYISPILFYQAIGKPLPSKYRETEELQGENRYTVITDPVIARKISWEVR